MSGVQESGTTNTVDITIFHMLCGYIYTLSHSPALDRHPAVSQKGTTKSSHATGIIPQYKTAPICRHNFSWLSPQVMYLLKYPLLNLVSHHYKPGFVPIVCLWTQINPNLSFLPPLKELSYYLIRSLLTFQACQFHSVTTSKYLVQCLILASLSLNTPILFLSYSSP